MLLRVVAGSQLAGAPFAVVEVRAPCVWFLHVLLCCAEQLIRSDTSIPLRFSYHREIPAGELDAVTPPRRDPAVGTLFPALLIVCARYFCAHSLPRPRELWQASAEGMDPWRVRQTGSGRQHALRAGAGLCRRVLLGSGRTAQQQRLSTPQLQGGMKNDERGIKSQIEAAPDPTIAPTA